MARLCYLCDTIWAYQMALIKNSILLSKYYTISILLYRLVRLHYKMSLFLVNFNNLIFFFYNTLFFSNFTWKFCEKIRSVLVILHVFKLYHVFVIIYFMLFSYLLRLFILNLQRNKKNILNKSPLLKILIYQQTASLKNWKLLRNS